ncbi:Hsp20/alpha crystallin family protein [Legionella fairfieldensis]|uniref:Hsp20/alpha crystallin family protein n=1 Tax=Legionella fairfieldensis TaxID=45064 RepID=UPI00048ECF38|nr:Hsp20/alpha crystallin family protein [Legionella fairfieldensis]
MNNLRKNYFPIYREVEDMLEKFLTSQQSNDASFIETSSWAPLVDVKEEKSRFLVIADLPGVKKEDIHISLEEHILTLKGERNFEKEESKGCYTRRERAQGQFYRRFSLPQTADDANITAKYTHGVLEISIPKKEITAEKKIEVNIED